jgi:hypothetical protein
MLDAHQAPMSSDDVMAFVSERSRWSPLRPESAQFWRSGAIVVREDGVWELDRTHEVVRSAREAVRNRVSDVRRWAAIRPDTVAMEAHRQRIERERTAHARELAATRRVLVDGTRGTPCRTSHRSRSPGGVSRLTLSGARRDGNILACPKSSHCF